MSHSVLLGGALVRNNVHPVLAGEGGECLINGLFIGNGRQHLDNYMLVEHASPHCGSRQFYNGILDGHAHGVFHGRIIVHKDAQKTDAKQTNRNLLLSDDAQIDTKPQLEIYADDVKCTHGATIGQIEEDALFYLRSRGIDEVSARKLLLFAFASECLDRMKQGPVREARGRADQPAVCSRWPTLRLVRRQRTAARTPEETGRKSDDHRRQQIAQRVSSSAACATPVRSSTWRRFAATFLSSGRGFTAGRWFTWTMQPRRRSRRWSLMRSVATTSADNANIHRGVHFLSEHATEEYEAARQNGASVPQRRRCERDHLCSRRHGSHQPGGADLRPH